MIGKTKREQVIDQCKAVAHMAQAILDIHNDYVNVFKSGTSDQILDVVGERTAAWMETLGDMLNGIDAVIDEDDWIAPVLSEAQRRFPTAQVVSMLRGLDHE